MTAQPTDTLLGRSIRASILYGGMAAIFAIVYTRDWGIGLRYLAFLAWMLLNLLLWSATIREFLARRRILVLVPFVTVKLLWLVSLFGLFALLRIRKPADFVAFLLGLNTPFLVMFLKLLGRAIVERQSSGATLGAAPAETKMPQAPDKDLE